MRRRRRRRRNKLRERGVLKKLNNLQLLMVQLPTITEAMCRVLSAQQVVVATKKPFHQTTYCSFRICRMEPQA
ncbi:unnamed protein product [Linum tenue]|uniref:Uncharacterized protein n=1 Tax=Linum tenue TaxID=586396 RepID=A0AAV0S276_9ROSI|nr:unnamed protein product [Linum tenue]